MDMYTRKDGTTKNPVKRTDLVEAHWTPSEIERDWYIVKPQWSGDGLPPVGTVCEFWSVAGRNKTGIEKVEVKYLSEFTFVGLRLDLTKGPEQEIIAHPINAKFRPIRTAEQIAEEEREQWIQSFCNEIDVPHAIGARTFDKGYRKQADQ